MSPKTRTSPAQRKLFATSMSSYKNTAAWGRPQPSVWHGIQIYCPPHHISCSSALACTQNWSSRRFSRLWLIPLRFLSLANRGLVYAVERTKCRYMHLLHRLFQWFFGLFWTRTVLEDYLSLEVWLLAKITILWSVSIIKYTILSTVFWWKFCKDLLLLNLDT